MAPKLSRKVCGGPFCLPCDLCQQPKQRHLSLPILLWLRPFPSNPFDVMQELSSVDRSLLLRKDWEHVPACKCHSCELSNAITNLLGIKQAKSTIILDVISASTTNDDHFLDYTKKWPSLDRLQCITYIGNLKILIIYILIPKLPFIYNYVDIHFLLTFCQNIRLIKEIDPPDQRGERGTGRRGCQTH